ncbi:MAG: T9SS C-terminal target domain-containing protein, partial [Candidatus Neomarinimicrobiota bacterium]
ISVLGNDGLYLATFDASTGTKLIRLTKVSAQLDSLWNRDGVLIHETTADQRRPFLIPLDNGVVVFWSEIRNAIDFDIYFQVFSADGQRLGPVDGYPLAESYFVDEYVEWATVTPEGDLLVFWKEDTWGAGVLKAVRVTTAGQVVFGWPPTGLSVAGPTGNPDALRGKDLPGTGVLVVWEETRDQARDVYGQIFDWDGNPLLASQGMALTTAPNDQTNPSLAVNQTMGTALVVWEDFRDGLDFNLYGQLIDVQGFGLLDSNQVICDAEQYQLRPYVAALDEFGYGIVWEDERGSMAEDPVLTGGMDVYLNGFSDHLLFPSSGIPVIQEYHDQKNPQIHRLNHDEYLLIWQDLRSSGKADLVNLYGTVLQRTDLLESRNSTPLPGSFRLKPAYPNPFNGAVAIPVDIPSLQPLRLAIINLRGETVYSSLVLPQTVGNQVLRWEGKTVTGEPVPSGVYILEVDYGGTRYSGKLTYLK